MAKIEVVTKMLILNSLYPAIIVNGEIRIFFNAENGYVNKRTFLDHMAIFAPDYVIKEAKILYDLDYSQYL